MAKTAAEIRAEIRYYENLISSYNKSIYKLRDEVKALQDVKSKLGDVQNEFSKSRARYKSKVSAVLTGSNTKLKSIKGYVNSMNDTLNNSSYNVTCNEIDLTTKSVNQKINKAKSDIDSYEKKISSARAKINTLKIQLKVAEN